MSFEFERPDPAQCFAQTVAVLGGARPPLTAGASKVLYFMLHSPEGCDARMTPEQFVIQYGWHLGHHPYYEDTAPPIVSWLLQESRVHGAVERSAAVLPARQLPEIERFMPWGHGARAVWIDATPAQIRIWVRDATSPTIPAVPPAAIDSPIDHLAGTWPCPHCHAQPDRYSLLACGAVICLACGLSSSRPPS